ncbi:PREDICTED: reticulon-1-A [Drosophila arizonae]|uniref:Reticulon-like protein n=1 Tax=Drosophila arizonae TaxID=7263 RepID=A0ABM1P8Q1_DROAR|nr:PREDICTED: reticulon-1-A [Drosophila arizonae]
MDQNMPDTLTAWRALVLWQNWRRTALFFIFTLTLLLDMATNPVISVASVAGAITISICIAYCCYVWGMRKLRKSCNAEHPLKRYLDMDVTISRKTAEQLAHLLVSKLNPILLRLRSLFLVEDMLDSLKMLLIFCCLNIVGDFIKGMTLLVVAFILLFTLPKLYVWKKKTIHKKLEQLQMLKAQLLSSNPKMTTVPTVAVDPQVLDPDLKKMNYVDNDMEIDTEQYDTYEQTSTPDCSSDYTWQEKNMPSEGILQSKQL